MNFFPVVFKFIIRYENYEYYTKIKSKLKFKNEILS